MRISLLCGRVKLRHTFLSHVVKQYIRISHTQTMVLLSASRCRNSYQYCMRKCTITMSGKNKYSGTLCNLEYLIIQQLIGPISVGYHKSNVRISVHKITYHHGKMSIQGFYISVKSKVYTCVRLTPFLGTLNSSKIKPTINKKVTLYFTKTFIFL